MFFSKTPSSVKIAEDSSNLLDIFTETRDRLSVLNDRADNEDTILDQQIAQLTAQKTLLEETRTRNSSVIAKIDKIFE